MSRSKNWCFTLNNPTEEEIQHLVQLQTSKEISYLIFGHEEGEQGTHHLQGYLELPRKKVLGGLKRLLSDRYHLEIRRGTQTQAKDYCKKDGNVVELGLCSKQGERIDLLAIRNRIDEGDSLAEIATDDDAFAKLIQYRKGLEWYASTKLKPRSEKSEVWVLCGPTGTGKTRRAFWQSEQDGKDLYVWGGDRWFDGYVGQPYCLLDDFEGGIDYRQLLRLLDRYPMRVPIKGGFVEWNPEKIFLTSNRFPEFWYPEQLNIDPLMRRIEHFLNVHEGYVHPWDEAE